MSKILLLYSTIDGHTLKICERLRDCLEPGGHAVTLRALEGPSAPELGLFDKIVVGASIRYGRHRPGVAAFLRTHRAVLQSKPSAFFSVNIVARKPDRNTPDTNPYVRKLLGQIAWRPRQLAVFAGKLDYPRYAFWDRQLIRFIMLLTRGPTDPRVATEFTDWAQVERFARTISEM